MYHKFAADLSKALTINSTIVPTFYNSQFVFCVKHAFGCFTNCINIFIMKKQSENIHS